MSKIERTTLEDFDTLDFVVAHNNILEQRGSDWLAIVEKYSNCNDTEDDGFDLDKIVEICEAEEENGESQETDDDLELEAEEAENEGFIENFALMKKADQYKHLTCFFSPEVLNTCMDIVKQKTSELDKQNLPFWNFNLQIMSTCESYKDVTVTTPDFSFQSKGFDRTTNMQVASLQSNSLPTFQFSNINLNGKPMMNAASDNILAQINSLVDNKAMFTVNIKEREYNIDFRGPNDQLGEISLKSIMDVDVKTNATEKQRNCGSESKLMAIMYKDQKQHKPKKSLSETNLNSTKRPMDIRACTAQKQHKSSSEKNLLSIIRDKEQHKTKKSLSETSLNSTKRPMDIRAGAAKKQRKSSSEKSLLSIIRDKEQHKTKKSLSETLLNSIKGNIDVGKDATINGRKTKRCFIDAGKELKYLNKTSLKTIKEDMNLEAGTAQKQRKPKKNLSKKSLNLTKGDQKKLSILPDDESDESEELYEPEESDESEESVSPRKIRRASKQQQKASFKSFVSDEESEDEKNEIHLNKISDLPKAASASSSETAKENKKLVIKPFISDEEFSDDEL